MTTATACCKCEICGHEFEKTLKTVDRQAADLLVKWTEENMTICPSCYEKQQRKKEKDAGLIAKIRFGPTYRGNDGIWVVLFGDTYGIRNKLKEMGARWTDAYPVSNKVGGSLPSSMRRPIKRWAILLFDRERLLDRVERLEDIGFSIVFPWDDIRNDPM